MEWIATLGRTMGFSFAAGINLYATVAILGLASRYDWVSLPPQYQAFDNDFIIAAALGLYVVEFVADKIPWFDSIWDTVHTAKYHRDRLRLRSNAQSELHAGRDGVPCLRD